MSDNWFYFKNHQQQGPVTMDALKQMASRGALTFTDLIWNEGMADWTPASQVPGLVAQSPPAALKAPPPPRRKTDPTAAPAILSATPWRPTTPTWASTESKPSTTIAKPTGRSRTRQMVVVGIAACLIPGVLSTVWSVARVLSTPVTLANYNKIKPGMTENEVEATLGPGDEQSSTSIETPGFRSPGVQVPGIDAGGVHAPDVDVPGVDVQGVSMSASNKVWKHGFKIITITFLNGRVQAKGQVGL